MSLISALKFRKRTCAISRMDYKNLSKDLKDNVSDQRILSTELLPTKKHKRKKSIPYSVRFPDWDVEDPDDIADMYCDLANWSIPKDLPAYIASNIYCIIGMLDDLTDVRPLLDDETLVNLTNIQQHLLDMQIQKE